MIYMSQKNLRNYVKLELTESAKEKLNQVADSRDMKLMGVSSRIIEWFVQQDQLFQSKYKCHDRRMINTFLNVLKPVAKAMPEAFTDGMSVRAVGRKYHLFRHDFAVRAAKAGVPIPELKNWLGHSSITTTMIYAQYSPEKYSEYIERI